MVAVDDKLMRRRKRAGDCAITAGGWRGVPPGVNPGGSFCRNISQLPSRDANLVTTQTWGVTQRYIYSPYGSLIVLNADFSAPPAGTQAVSDYLYQGMTLDAVTGLYYARNRNYSPSLGVWISQDPLQYVNGANTYQMEVSGPVGSVDPGGMITAQLTAHTTQTPKIDPFGKPLRLWGTKWSYAPIFQLLPGTSYSAAVVQRVQMAYELLSSSGAVLGKQHIKPYFELWGAGANGKFSPTAGKYDDEFMPPLRWPVGKAGTRGVFKEVGTARLYGPLAEGEQAFLQNHFRQRLNSPAHIVPMSYSRVVTGPGLGNPVQKELTITWNNTSSKM